ncbi:unnamed protein product [Closterium sp. NIES-54]
MGDRDGGVRGPTGGEYRPEPSSLLTVARGAPVAPTVQQGPAVEVAAGAATEPTTAATAATCVAAAATAAAETTAVAAAVVTATWQARTGELTAVVNGWVELKAVGNGVGRSGGARSGLVRWNADECGSGACGSGSVRSDAAGSHGGQFSVVGSGEERSRAVECSSVRFQGGVSEGLGFESQCVHFGHPSAGGCQRSTGDPRLILVKGYRLNSLGVLGELAWVECNTMRFCAVLCCFVRFCAVLYGSVRLTGGAAGEAARGAAGFNSWGGLRDGAAGKAASCTWHVRAAAAVRACD